VPRGLSVHFYHCLSLSEPTNSSTNVTQKLSTLMTFRQHAGESLLVLAMPLREVAFRLSLASHDFTYGSGFQMISGDPAV